jgi:virulence-associated protein VagC
VSIRREGDQLIVEPVKTREWPESFWRAFGDMPDDLERPAQRPQRRESLDL